MCIKKYLAAVACFFFLLVIPAGAQRVLLEERVDTSGVIPRQGPNRFFFAHGLGRIGLLTGPQEYGMQTNWWSASITYGARMKFKLWSWDALVVDFGYHFDNYSLRKKQPSLPPFYPHDHQRARLGVNNLTFAFCDRINFGRRGNVMGTWLDLGVYGDWAFHSAYVYVDQYYSSTSPYGGRFKAKTHVTRLPYLAGLNYGFTAHFGNDSYGIFVNYRVNDFITNPGAGTNYHDLPRLMIGIETYHFDE